MATRIRHARGIARWYASAVLENAEIGFWAVDNSDLNEDEISEAQQELYRIAGRISAQRAQQREGQ
ncbi:hypothetical protein [Comamonas squillarum]|uniref:Uncharacterized protein n=1 Tax=Comamonas squillarum TaxID=2977320 RepID=A0ABY6A1D2_9BURK|nr:hypothetical protein [Comamonas sp. PR12]UXC20062.1 hypothetical protein N4T19_08120 [Comamonas sp. PR12]